MRRQKGAIAAGILINLCLIRGAFAMTQNEFIALCRTGTAEEIVLALADKKLSAAASDAKGITPLMNAAAARGDAASVKKIQALVASGAKPNATDTSGMTALMHAAQHCDKPEIIVALLQGGAKRDLQDRRGWTALSCAAGKNFEARMTEILIDAGSNPNHPDGAGLTPLMLALRGGVGKNVVTALLDAGADPATKDKSGKTALDYLRKSPLKDDAEIVAALKNPAAVKAASPARFAQVCRLGSVDRLKKLLDAGNDPNALVDGLTPLMWVARAGSKDALALLIEHGARLNDRDPEGRTALMYAADAASLKILLSEGARIGIADKNGRTALEYAQENPNLKPADYEKMEPFVAEFRATEGELNARFEREHALRIEKEKRLSAAEAKILYLQKQLAAEKSPAEAETKH